MTYSYFRCEQWKGSGYDYHKPILTSLTERAWRKWTKRYRRRGIFERKTPVHPKISVVLLGDPR